MSAAYPDQHSSLELGRLKGGWGYFFFHFTRLSLIVACYNSYAISWNFFRIIMSRSWDHAQELLRILLSDNIDGTWYIKDLVPLLVFVIDSYVRLLWERDSHWERGKRLPVIWWRSWEFLINISWLEPTWTWYWNLHDSCRTDYSYLYYSIQLISESLS